MACGRTIRGLCRFQIGLWFVLLDLSFSRFVKAPTSSHTDVVQGRNPTLEAIYEKGWEGGKKLPTARTFFSGGAT